MCPLPRPVDPAPEETVWVAKAAFPKGSVYMTMRDELGATFEDEDFAHLFPRRGQPAMAPSRLALVTIMQFAEGLSDRQTADAVWARIDYRYALSLELDDPGFDASVDLPGRQAEHKLESRLDNRHNRVVKLKFSSKDSMACPGREKCIRSTRRCKRRSVTVWADGQQQALEAARLREKEPGFAAVYARRAGLEGTVSRAVRTCDVRRFPGTLV